jgi:hypothetical protein
MSDTNLPTALVPEALPKSGGLCSHNCPVLIEPLMVAIEGLQHLDGRLRLPAEGVEGALEGADWHHGSGPLIKQRLYRIKGEKKVTDSQAKTIAEWFESELDKQYESETGCDFVYWYKLLKDVFEGLPEEVGCNEVSCRLTLLKCIIDS